MTPDPVDRARTRRIVAAAAATLIGTAALTACTLDQLSTSAGGATDSNQTSTDTGSSGSQTGTDTSGSQTGTDTSGSQTGTDTSGSQTGTDTSGSQTGTVTGTSGDTHASTTGS